jgi:hypothetical protein
MIYTLSCQVHEQAISFQDMKKSFREYSARQEETGKEKVWFRRERKTDELSQFSIAYCFLLDIFPLSKGE